MKLKPARRSIMVQNSNRFCANCGKPVFLAILRMSPDPWIYGTSEAVIYGLCLGCCMESVLSQFQVEEKMEWQAFIPADFKGGSAIPLMGPFVEASGLMVR
jgi:hypothetical protein